MVERYEYAYTGWFCKLDHKQCIYDGECDKCFWAKMKKAGEERDCERRDKPA